MFQLKKVSFVYVLISNTFEVKSSKLNTIEFLSTPLLSPPVTGFINSGNFIGIDDFQLNIHQDLL